MLIKEIMERVGMTQTGRALAYIRDALDEMAISAETHTDTSQIDLVKDQRYYSIPADCIKLIDIRCKDHDNDDGKLRAIPRTIYKPVIIDEVDPTLTLSVSSLTIPSGTTSASISITNTDSDGNTYKDLSWNVSASEVWMSLSVSSGITGSEIDSLVITFDKDGLVGSYTGELAFTSNGGDITIPVSMTIGSPNLGATPLFMDFASGDETKTLYISNAGESELIWSIANSFPSSGIDLDFLSGTSLTDTDSVTVTTNRASLSSGTTSGILTVSGNGDSINKVINITVEKA